MRSSKICLDQGSIDRNRGSGFSDARSTMFTISGTSPRICQETGKLGFCWNDVCPGQLTALAIPSNCDHHEVTNWQFHMLCRYSRLEGKINFVRTPQSTPFATRGHVIDVGIKEQAPNHTLPPRFSTEHWVHHVTSCQQDCPRRSIVTTLL